MHKEINIFELVIREEGEGRGLRWVEGVNQYTYLKTHCTTDNTNKLTHKENCVYLIVRIPWRELRGKRIRYSHQKSIKKGVAQAFLAAKRYLNMLKNKAKNAGNACMHIK